MNWRWVNLLEVNLHASYLEESHRSLYDENYKKVRDKNQLI